MNTYTFGFGGTFSSDDPATPMGGVANITLVISAESIDDAKAALATTFTPTVGDSTVDVSGIYVVPE
jgi:hypothetical protein